MHVEHIELDPPLRDDERSAARAAPGRRTRLWWSAIAGFAIAVAIVAALHYARQPTTETAPAAPPVEPAPAAPQAQAQPSAPSPAAEVERYPVAPAGSAQTLPELGNSDAFIARTLRDLFGADAVGRLLHTGDIVRRFVAMVDKLPRHGPLWPLMPIKPPEERLMTLDRDGAMLLDGGNVARYSPYVRLVEAANPQVLVALYLRVYPLLEEQYRALGYPQGHFNDRMVAAIDDLLAAPEVDAPIELVRARAMYAFADPDLEQLSAGQKAMIRIGPANAAIVKSKLRAIRERLTASQAADDASAAR